MKRCSPCQLATVCVPWSEAGAFLEPVFRRQVRLLREAGLENLYIFGTAGEGYAVTDPVFKAVATVFFDAMRDGAGLCQLGVIGMSVAQIRARIEMGLEIGFREFQISLPSWGAVTDPELARFFRDVLGSYPQARFLHYNLGRAGRVLTGADYTRLAAEHPNLVATKSGGHTVAALLALFEGSPELCHFLTELDYVAACLLGSACGLLVSVSAVCPARSRELFEVGQAGDSVALCRLMRDLHRLRAQVLALVAGEGGHMDGAYDKLYARLADPEFPLGLLSPYQGASPTAFEMLKTWLTQEAPAGWRWRKTNVLRDLSGEVTQVVEETISVVPTAAGPQSEE